MRGVLGLTLAVIVMLIVAHVLWKGDLSATRVQLGDWYLSDWYLSSWDPGVAELQDPGDDAWEFAEILKDQGADETTCAAKLKRHFDLSSAQTAWIISEVYEVDIRPCADALEVVYEMDWVNAAQTCSGCPDPANTYLDEARTSYRRPRWMGAIDDLGICGLDSQTCELGNFGAHCLEDRDCDVRVSHLSIPGTHETMVRCESGGGPSIQCNDLFIAEQLRAGIRALDIRVRHAGCHFDVTHSCYMQSWNCDNYIAQHYQFEHALCPVVSFLTEYPSETVLMRVSDAGCPIGETCGFYEIFEDYMESDCTVGGDSVPVADYVWKPDRQNADRYCLDAPSTACSADSDCPSGPCVDKAPRLRDVRGKMVLLTTFGTPGKPDPDWALSLPCTGEENCADGSPFFDVQDDFAVYATVVSMRGKRANIERQLDQAGDYDCRPPNVCSPEQCAPDCLGTDCCSADECAEPCEWEDRDRNWIFVNHTSGTGQGAPPYPEDVARSVLIGGSCWEGTLETTYVRLQHYEDTYDTIERTGLVMMDYPGPPLIDAIIARNPVGVAIDDPSALPISCQNVVHHSTCCGIGPELLPIMALLLGMHRRAARREEKPRRA